MLINSKSKQKNDIIIEFIFLVNFYLKIKSIFYIRQISTKHFVKSKQKNAFHYHFANLFVNQSNFDPNKCHEYVKMGLFNDCEKRKKEKTYLNEFLEARQCEQYAKEFNRQFNNRNDDIVRENIRQNQSRVTTIKSDMNKSRNNSHNRKISNSYSTQKKKNQTYVVDNYNLFQGNQGNYSKFQPISSNFLSIPSNYIPLSSNLLTLTEKSYQKNQIDQRNSLHQLPNKLNSQLTPSLYPFHTPTSPTQTPVLFPSFFQSSPSVQFISSIQYKKMQQILNSKNTTLQNQNQYLKDQIRKLYKKQRQTKLSYKQRLKLLKKQRQIYQLQYQQLKRYVLDVILKIMKMSQKEMEIRNCMNQNDENKRRNEQNIKCYQNQQYNQCNQCCQEIIFNCSKELIEKLNQDMFFSEGSDEKNIQDEYECKYSYEEENQKYSINCRNQYDLTNTQNPRDYLDNKQSSYKRLPTQISQTKNQLKSQSNFTNNIKNTEKNHKDKFKNNKLPPPYPKSSQLSPQYNKYRSSSNKINYNQTNEKHSCSILFQQPICIDIISQNNKKKQQKEKVLHEDTSSSTQCPNINQQIDELTDQTQALMYQLKKTDNKDSQIKKKIIKITQKIRQLKIEKDQTQNHIKVKEFQSLLHLNK